MNPLFGSFYFRIGNDGNLFGEFTNANIHQILQHSAISDGEITNRILGNYIAQWIDFDGEIYVSTLEITSLNSNKFTLTWNGDNSPIYVGEGIIVDNMIIGHYVQR